MGRHAYVKGRRRLLLWLAIMSVATAAALVGGQSGFLSIDCGKDKGTSYKDPKTDLLFTSDFQYVSTGEIHMVSSTYRKKPSYGTQAYDLRSFPDGNRNCYKLPIKPDQKYLLRASFMYGNYDGKNKLPQFAIHVGVNHWQTVVVSDASVNQISDFVFVAGPRGSINVCLVKTGRDTPFISSLELRPLPNMIYPQANASQASRSHPEEQPGCHHMQLRYPNDQWRSHTWPSEARASPNPRRKIRNPDSATANDVFDRIWFPYSSNQWTVLTTSSQVQVEPNYQAPSDVLRTAVAPMTGSKLSTNFTAYVDPVVPCPQFFYIFFHFAELQKLKANQSRVFNINLDGKPWISEAVKPTYLKGSTAYNINPETVNPLNFELVQNRDSTLPPIMNAVEVYSVRDMSGVETAEQDVYTMMVVKEVYKLQKNWEGDPCFPMLFIWEGLNCSADGSSKSPRITSLNLSSFGLTGEISAAIANLTQLQTLDLSKNSLIGEIPVFLASLTQLNFLDLSGNKLNGNVPQPLPERVATGRLTLKVDRSADSCNGSTSCDHKKSTSKVVAAIGASVGFLLVLALIILVIIWRRKQGPGRLEKQNRGNNAESQKIHTSRSFTMESMPIENKQFTYSDLERITNNFEKEIGRGGFGPVYFGVLENTVEVAVKLLSKSSSQGPKEFQNEASS